MNVVWRKPSLAGDRAVVRRWTTAPGVLGVTFVDDQGTDRGRTSLV